jgi:lysozyme
MDYSENCVKLIKHFEGFRPMAYKLKDDVWTIGYGSTRYENGYPVGPGDAISEARALEIFEHDINSFSKLTRDSVKSNVNQSQFDALVSFYYNTGKLNKSSLLRVINLNPNDPEIEELFLRWKYIKGKPSKGLVRRRLAEAHLYLHGELKTDFEEALINKHLNS